MLASGQLRSSNTKSVSSATQQAPNEIGFKVIGQQPTASAKPAGINITYTPTGKQQQTYSVVGTQIFNKDNVEVFKENSTDRNKIFANVAVKTGRAVVVNHKGSSYVVNNRNQVISAKTGKIMQWDQTNGDLIAILAQADKMFAPAGAGITMKEIDDIYNQKSVKNVTLEQYRKDALEFIKTMSAAGMSKSAILEQLTCL